MRQLRACCDEYTLTCQSRGSDEREHKVISPNLRSVSGQNGERATPREICMRCVGNATRLFVIEDRGAAGLGQGFYQPFQLVPPRPFRLAGAARRLRVV